MELFRLFGTIAVNNDEANSAIDETTNNAEKSENRMSGAFKKIGAAVAAAFAVDKIIDFGKQVVSTAAEVAAEQSSFEQIMGEYSATAQQKVNEIADATGMVSTRLTPYMTSMTAKFKGLGYDIDDATTLASDGLNLAADASAFWDKSLDDSMGALNSFINGSYEGGEAIGLFANDTQLASYAVSQGIVSQTKDWAALDEATKQATRLEYAEQMFAMSGATGQAAKEADQYANVQANLTEKWRQFKAQIGEPLLQNVVLPVMDKLSGVVDVISAKFEDLKKWVSENQDTIEKWKNGFQTALTILTPILAGLAAGMLAYKTVTLATTAAEKAGAIAKGIYAVVTGQSTKAQIAAKLAQMGLNGAMLMSPVTWVIAGLVALVAAFVLLWNKSEGFRKFWIGLWDTIKTAASNVWNWIKNLFTVTIPNVFNSFKSTVSSVFNKIKTAIETPINKARDIVKSAIDKIKSFFNFKWSLPKLKMPHVKISGKFSLVPPSIPKFSVDWYAKGGIMNQPTLFDFNPKTGTASVGGEAGAEAIAPIDTLMGYVRTAVQDENSGVSDKLERLISILSQYFPELLAKAGHDIVLNDGVLAGRLVPQIDKGLGDIDRARGRGQ